MRKSSCVGGVVTTLLEGLFEIDDRGDGFAEIALKGDFGQITAEDAAAWAQWDAQVGRAALPPPVGFKMTSKVVGYVHGDEGRVQAAQDDQTGEWTRAESAFPGYAQLRDTGNRAARVRVESIQDLEQYLCANRALALQHLPAAVHQVAVPAASITESRA